MYSIDQIRDNRSQFKAAYDYRVAKQNEKLVMDQIIREDMVYRGRDSWYEFVDETEAFNDGKKHIKPDVFYYNPKKYTFEIKFSTTGNFHDDSVYVKPGAIFTMCNDVGFENGFLLVATPRQYALMKSSVIAQMPLEVIDRWSNEAVVKKGFVIPIEWFDWKDWSVPIRNHNSGRF